MRENDFLQMIASHNAALPPSVSIPPGDDMAAMRFGDQTLLVGVDQVVDGIHFDLQEHGPEAAGRKAVTRCLSDVAAMAAIPVGAVVAALLPRGMGDDSARRLYDAVRQTGERFGCPVVGGDTAIGGAALVIGVTVWADPAGVEPLRRDGAQAGDWLCVTGRLGGAWAAIEGLELRAMMDLSDGLAADLPRLCRASAVGAQIDAPRLPVHDDAVELAARDGVDAWRHALNDGEDYELCFAAGAESAARLLPETIAGVPVTRIGQFEAPEVGAAPVWLRDPKGDRRPLEAGGWEHES